MSDAELDAFITSHGGDPAKLRARGEALAQELDARRDRLAWHGDMEKKLAASAPPPPRCSPPRARSSPATSSSPASSAPAPIRASPPRSPPSSAPRRPRRAPTKSSRRLLDQIELLAKLEDE